MSKEKRWMRHEIEHLIESKDKAVCRAVEALFARQTNDEQVAERTKHNNGRGFTGADSRIMSSFAKQIQRWNGFRVKRHKLPLSPKQVFVARKRLHKYAGQLTKIANGEL